MFQPGVKFQMKIIWALLVSHAGQVKERDQMGMVSYGNG